MAWEVFLIGTLTGVLLIAVVTAIGRLLREFALREQRTRLGNAAVTAPHSSDGNRIAQAERSAA